MKKNSICNFIVSGLLLFSPLSMFAQGVSTNLPWSVRMVESEMIRCPESWQLDFQPKLKWDYCHGLELQSMLDVYDRYGDQKIYDYALAYADTMVNADGTIKMYKREEYSLDRINSGKFMFRIYEQTKDEKYKKAALQILKAVDQYPSSDGQFWHGNRSPNMWIDGVFMMQMFLIRCAQYVGEADYCYDVACRNIITAARHLQRPDGLILHAWTTEPEKAVWADKTTGLSPEVWSEGMGWYTLVVPELLALLPKTHPNYQQVLDIYLKMCKGLKEVQDKKTGGWFMVVDKGDNPLNFVDPSGTAMFVYSIQRGVELGLLKAKEYTPVAYRGYQSLFPFIQVNDRGLLDVIGACDGVVIKKNFVEYVTVPKILNAKEAVAGILWAAVIMETEQLKK